MKIFNKLGFIAILLVLLTVNEMLAQFAKGADVSWVTQMENSGVKFYNNSGQQQDVFAILKGKGVNSIRLRVWLNPWEGWCGKQDVIAKAIRAKNAGLRIMIDFHYSDYWADPGQQAKPASWQNYSVTQLSSAIASHTTDVLNALKSNGISVEWVQVGNETNDGMLWEEGRASQNMKNYATFVAAGYDAVKSVYPSAKVVVHVSNGYDNGLFRWNFDGLKNNGGKWDVIGMSLYPTRSNWQTLNNQCLANMKDMVARYGKQVMVVEVGMEARQAADCKLFLTDLMNKTASLPNGAGLGVMYWEPQAYNRWQGYTKGAFDDKGRPTVALDAFLANITNARQASSIDDASSTDESEEINAYPNPVTNTITVQLPSASWNGSQLNIYNEKGQSMIRLQSIHDQEVIDVSTMPGGLYVLRVNNGRHVMTKKFIRK
jgi:arabinogalactan endo-1,4-beta-galactosidase